MEEPVITVLVIYGVGIAAVGFILIYFFCIKPVHEKLQRQQEIQQERQTYIKNLPQKFKQVNEVKETASNVAKIVSEEIEDMIRYSYSAPKHLMDLSIGLRICVHSNEFSISLYSYKLQTVILKKINFHNDWHISDIKYDEIAAFRSALTELLNDKLKVYQSRGVEIKTEEENYSDVRIDYTVKNKNYQEYREWFS